MMLMLGMTLGTSLSAHADGGQVVTVNGRTVANTVKQITFSGDQLTLTYADGTSESADLEQVTIVFTVADALKALGVKPGDASLNYFDLNGRQLTKAPRKGSYIVKRGDKVVKIMKK